MSLKMINGLTRLVGRVRLSFKRNGSKYLLYGGSLSIGAGLIIGCVNSTKLESTIDKAKEEIDRIKEKREQLDIIEYTDKEFKNELIKAKISGIKNIVKLYVPSATLTVAGLAGIYASNNMLSNENAVLAGAYAALQTGYFGYRKRVVEKYGEEEDQNLLYGATDIEIKRPDEFNNVVVEKVTKVQGNDDPVIAGQYSRFFDDSSPYYRYIVHKTVVGTEYIPDTEANFIFLLNIQTAMQSRLDKYGWLLLNTVYEACGFKPSCAGNRAGWLRGEKIDFGIFNPENQAARRFVNGLEEVVLLRFNVPHDDILNECLSRGTWVN